jgi:hypothetical protein
MINVALSTLEELQARYDALTGRIVAIDLDISREIDGERRKTLADRRTEMAIERERVAADIAILHPGSPLTIDANAPLLEHRVGKLERDILWVKGVLRPGPRAVVARVVFYGLLISVWSMWMIKEIRDWLIFHPLQAVTLTLVMVIAALIIRWLPEDDHDQR